jgi:hypothetical protein
MNAPLYCKSSAKEDSFVNALDVPIMDGLYSADDSREPVLKLLIDLQNYHQVRNFSHRERFGKPDPWSEKMLANLAEAITNAKQIIEDARHSDRPISVESSIRIKMPQ